MNRDQFDHAIRASGSILAVDEVLVIGSQAIHASTDLTFPELQRSIEVDIAHLGDQPEQAADLIDGSIGELSAFQDTFGYYAQGVTPSTAVLPSGWRDRLVPYESAATNGVKAMCLEPHDLWISKAVAGRTKDQEFCAQLQKLKLVEPKTLHARLALLTQLGSKVRAKVETLIEPT